MDFNAFRESYERMSYADQTAFYSEIYKQYPFQNYCNIDEAKRFFESLIRTDGPTPGRVVMEIGGWIGNTASKFLDVVPPAIDFWYNFEICAEAVQNGLKHPRYASYITNDYVWNLRLPQHNTLFMSHIIEHLTEAQIRLILEKCEASHCFIEAPLPENGPVNWNNDISTHVLTLNWHGLEAVFAEYGYEAYYRNGWVRFFKKVGV